MFLRSYQRKKNGKRHRYYSVVENRRVANGRVSQKTVLYLGEITSDQVYLGVVGGSILDADLGTVATGDLDINSLNLCDIQNIPIN